MWHGGWDPDAGYTALYLRLPEKALAFVVLSNGEGIWWDNPLNQAKVEDSDFAQAFMNNFVFNDDSAAVGSSCSN